MKPFFSILTRTMPGRAELFARCRASVDAQTFREVEHLVLRDEIGVGVAEAQRMLHTASPKGRFVFVLDDDDVLCGPGALADLHTALEGKRPAFAVVKVEHGQLGPMPRVWGEGQTPQCGEITVSNVVVEHVQWYLHRTQFGIHYAGDYDFIASLFAQHAPLWVNVHLVRVEEMRQGRGERVVVRW